MTDARTVLAGLRPQPFGTGRPDKVANPIVEPEWAGIRVLAAVDESGVVLVDEEGGSIDDQPEIGRALRGSALAAGIVLDGYLTKQAGQDGTGVFLKAGDAPTVGNAVGHFFFGSRRSRAADAAQVRAEKRQAATFEPDDVICFVATDLLWLDGESLLDVPLLERRRLLETVLAEADIVRRGTYVRPPIGGWVRSWRAQGFHGLTFRAANSRYHPGVASDDWVTAPMPR